MEVIHLPVLLHETIDAVLGDIDGIYVDGTIGLGGHCAELLRRLGPKGRIIGVDRDEEALQAAGFRLDKERVSLVRGNFADMREIVMGFTRNGVDGVILDLGVSTLQLKRMERGFSFESDARLDMRMDDSADITAWDIVNSYPRERLEGIILDYGQDHKARAIARAITSERSNKEIDTCKELAALVYKVYGKRGRRHPATRTFQALRMAVNDELPGLRSALLSLADILRTGGRFCVISYHSLEDGTVKHYFRQPDVSERFRTITKKPIVPSLQEQRVNPSSRSAKLRIYERI